MRRTQHRRLWWRHSVESGATEDEDENPSLGRKKEDCHKFSVIYAELVQVD